METGKSPLGPDCPTAAEALSKVQTEFLVSLTEEVRENYETLRDGEFMLKSSSIGLARGWHLNGLLQVLSQLSATVPPANPPNAS